MRTLSVICLLISGCNGCEAGVNAGDGGVDGGDGGSGWIDVRILQNAKSKVDLLFMVDNSPSMASKQMEFKARFPQLVQVIDTLGATTPVDYHIGVVTSDLGAGPFNINRGQCHPGGDGARLVVKGAAADTTCQTVGNGVNFIEYNQLARDAAGNPTTNLPAGFNVATMFNCMASVGDTGCGFESQLEAVYQALHDPIPENAGFLRDDALLVVVWVTDEDDCSADANSDLFEPMTTNYGALLSYRCTRFGIACDPPGTSMGPLQLMPYGDSGGPLVGCVPADATMGGKLLDVTRYIDFFTRPKAAGGVKVDPNDVILTGITAPDDLVQSILADISAPVGPYLSCPGPIDPRGTGCSVVLQHSCVAPTSTAFFGDPAVRIRAVINSAANQENASICDASYQSAMQGIGAAISAAVVGGCVNLTKPKCEVDIDTSGMTTAIPQCNLGAPPCWSLGTNAACGSSPQLTVTWPPSGPPPNTSAHGRCMPGP
jgi:hypothetical protein